MIKLHMLDRGRIAQVSKRCFLSLRFVRPQVLLSIIACLLLFIMVKLKARYDTIQSAECYQCEGKKAITDDIERIPVSVHKIGDGEFDLNSDLYKVRSEENVSSSKTEKESKKQAVSVKLELRNTREPDKLYRLYEDRQVILREGRGLEPITLESGEKAWRENQVVYRKYQETLNKTQAEIDFPSPNKPEFQPFFPFEPSTFFEGEQPKLPIEEKDKKIILQFIPTRYWPPVNGLQPLRACPDVPCLTTTNVSYSSESAALIFAGQRIIEKQLPRREHKDQVFIFNNHESPSHLKQAIKTLENNRTGWNRVFNWTMTYRLDSDIISYYGLVRKRRTALKRNYNYIVMKKKYLAVRFVSNCKSPGGRDEYYKELSKYMKIDTYGSCGKYKCSRDSENDCENSVISKYKFILGMENSICEDYITEKFFRYLTMDVITVARGSNEYAFHSPTDIFLNTADFETPEDLAKRMIHLDNHDDEYIQILKRKDQYMVLFEEYSIRNSGGNINYMTFHYDAVPFCEVCQRLWNLDNYRQSIENIAEWVKRKMCRRPTDLDFTTKNISLSDIK